MCDSLRSKAAVLSGVDSTMLTNFSVNSLLTNKYMYSPVLTHLVLSGFVSVSGSCLQQGGVGAEKEKRSPVPLTKSNFISHLRMTLNL